MFATLFIKVKKIMKQPRIHAILQYKYTLFCGIGPRYFAVYRNLFIERFGVFSNSFGININFDRRS